MPASLNPAAKSTGLHFTTTCGETRSHAMHLSVSFFIIFYELRTELDVNTFSCIFEECICAQVSPKISLWLVYSSWE